jgi:NTP pyrophosphatase (non-canonical NTP hydrolase)
MKDLNAIWKDQSDFNRNFFPEAEDFGERSRQTKEFSLHMLSEVDELLRATAWKLHRKQNVLANPEQVKNELTDILKYLVSLYNVWGISPEEALKDYWRKSMVVRQRYSEEFVCNLEGKIVLCDIDGVIANYVSGLLGWVGERYPSLRQKCLELSRKNEWLNATALGVHEQVWQEMKHDFRTSRGKVRLPVYEGSKEFLAWCDQKGYKIVLLTSRPIDRYPNIYTDTLEWLKNHELRFDYIWWAIDKGEKILASNIKSNIVMALDDDKKYVARYHELGIPCYHITPSFTVKDLHEKLQKEVV